MSRSGNSVSVRACVAGVIPPMLLGGLFGSTFAIAAWSEPFWVCVRYGLLIGAAPSLVAGALAAWHGSAVASSNANRTSPAVWGIVTGLVVGAVVGPLLGAILGGWAGHLADGILVGGFGLVAGPAAWEIAYWVSSQ